MLMSMPGTTFAVNGRYPVYPSQENAQSCMFNIHARNPCV
jgi:hypothetical protein